jgi:hypothetical protein
MFTSPFQSPRDNNTRTKVDAGQFYYPLGYKEQVSNNADPFQYPPAEYLATPLPPPPPLRPKKPIWLFCLVGFSVVALIVGVGFFGYSLGDSSSKVSSSAATSTPVSTPTLDAKTMIHAGDFTKFFEAFATAMANKDYATIQSVTDTENFQSIALYADGGFGTWNDMYSQLNTGNISFILHYPPITADQENYSCVGYGSKGVPSLNVNISANDIQYVVGTASRPGDSGSLQTQIDATVFVFEIPYGPANFWLWRAVFFNNVAGCNA